MKFVAHSPMPTRNVLLYGPPKTKKTTAACSAPAKRLLLNADLPNATWFAREQYDVDELAWEGFALMQEIEDGVKTPAFGYATVIVDPIGELYRLLLEEFSRMAVSPTLPTYQAVSVHLERFCRALCRSPHVNAVFVCHEHPVKNEVTGSFENLPWTGTQNPTLGNKLMSMVDVIGFTGVVEAEDPRDDPAYVAQLVNGKGRRGGDRTHTLGKVRALDLGEWFTTMASAPPTKPEEQVKAEEDTAERTNGSADSAKPAQKEKVK